jgi:DNA modification methylase
MQTAPELIPQIVAGNMSIPEAKREVKRQQQQERVKAQSEIERAEQTATATIYHGDCFDHISLITDGTITAAIIDPPYNVTDFDWDKIGSDAEFIRFTKSWLDAIKPKFKADYHLFIFCDASYSADIEMLLRRDGWPIKSRVIWEYRNLVMGRDATDKFIQNWQMCFHIGNGKLNWSQIWDDSRFAVQQFATPQSNFTEGKHHPHQKPLGLIENLVKAGSGEGDTVLDIFAGSGTTGLAAIKNNRNVILIEQSAEYIAIIKERLQVAE